ncbi:MAG: 13E12 repeat family protein [Candidatus Dormibacteraeota bacterium]|nr:13E12 repeat family protein [Candidatus Dormibacteraeota bacterium]
MALSCATWLSHNLQISSIAAHAQVHLARRLTSLPATATAFQRGELSPQHASVIGRGVEAEEQA